MAQPSENMSICLSFCISLEYSLFLDSSYIAESSVSCSLRDYCFEKTSDEKEVLVLVGRVSFSDTLLV